MEEQQPVQEETITTTGEEGATATEYALLVGLIALIIAVGVLAFGGALNTWFNSLATTVATW
ncbi:Flp family type IVb pilin [Sinomonas sp. ASV486]|uniref:Flp family type IVb pilin n=1 Tax=Sinomonas sp. ASV486 TaxID=3051170 RepID=UPI0027DD143C|nr:Flp family type IVb pilin [Sinomonas sp. ASV486]MDQ4488802.1 Flp family type IVb pilin [Sinomonas sp. ASV486]